MKGRNSSASRLFAILCMFAMLTTMFPSGMTFAESPDEEQAEMTKEIAPKQTNAVSEEEPSDGEAKEEGKEKEKEKEESIEEGETKEEPANAEEKKEPSDEKAVKDESGTNEEKDKKETAEQKSSGDEGKTDKAEEKEEKEPVLYKAEFDFGDNYANFDEITGKTADKDGKLVIPEKPKAREKVYTGLDGEKYYFTGWEYKDEEYEPGDKLTLSVDAKFTAVWKKTYMIEFSAVGIEANKVKSQTEVFGEPVELPDETASKDGYDFAGWTPDDGDTVYAPDTPIRANAIQPKGASRKLALRAALVDDEAPVLTVVYNETESTTDKIVFDVSATDNSSSEITIKYIVTDSNSAPDVSDVGWTEKKINSGDTISIDRDRDPDHYLYVLAIDGDGNTTPIVMRNWTSNESEDDKNPPNVTNNTDSNRNPAPSKEIEFTVDDGSGGSGVKPDDIRIIVYREGTDEVVLTITPEPSDYDNAEDKYIVRLQNEKLTGPVDVVIEATDGYGNVGKSDKKTYFIDGKIPSLEEFSMTGAKNNDHYYSALQDWKIELTADEDIKSAKVSIGDKEYDLTVDSTDKNKASLDIATSDINAAFADSEDEYALTVIIKDLADNQNSPDNQKLDGVATSGLNDQDKKIVVDTIAPVLTEATTSPSSKIVDAELYYYKENAKTTYTITEGYTESFEITYKKDGETTSKEFTSVDDVSVEWSGSYAKYTDIAIEGSDKAGNLLILPNPYVSEDYEDTVSGPAQNGKISFKYGKVIDTEAPKVTLTIGDFYTLTLDKNGEKLINPTGPFRKDKEAVITVAAEDDSPVSVRYRVRYNKAADDIDVNSFGWENDFPSTKDPYYDDPTYDETQFSNNRSVSKTMEGEVQFEVYDIQVTDRAGKETKIDSTNIIYLDGTKPDPNVDVVKPQVKITATNAVTQRGADGQNLYNDSVDLKFSVEDPNKWKSSSGLKKVSYAVYVDGKEDTRYKENPKYPNGLLQKWETSNTTLGSNAEIEVKPQEYYVTLEKGKYESNRIKVVLIAEDNAGNKGETSTLFGIDSVGPEITVSYDNNDVENGKYFDANRTATVTVKERNLGTNSDKISIKTQVGVPGSWDYQKGSDESGNDDKWIKKFSYTKDGDYTIYISGTDALGNPAEVTTYTGPASAQKAFTIDKTRPIVKVTFDNNNARNKKYYNANRNATITINEHNFRDSDVEVEGKASGPRRSSMGFPSRSRFSSRGNLRTASIPFHREGDYSFNVTYSDLAGNPAQVVKIDEFVIDKTNPTVRIDNVIDAGIYGGTVAPIAVFDDDNFSLEDSQFRFAGVRAADRRELIPAFRSNGEYGGSYVMSDFPRLRNYDDIYTAYAESTDMAGNSTSVSLSFSVNRFGSSYDYNNDATTENLVSKEKGRYYTNVKEALELREINVNNIKDYTVTLDRGGSSTKLEEGKDFTVVKSSTDMGTQYIYKISDEVVSDEGTYNLVVKSEDAAGNINTNAAVRSEEEDNDVPVKFVYDVTAPTMNFLRASNNDVIELKLDGKNSFRNTDILDLGIVPKDDWALTSIKYTLSNKSGVIDEKSYSGEEFQKVMSEEGDQHFLEEIANGTDMKTLEITVCDAAGNETTNTYNIMVTKNFGQMVLANWYWILLAIAAGCGAFAYYLKRRNNQDDVAA